MRLNWVRAFLAASAVAIAGIGFVSAPAEAAPPAKAAAVSEAAALSKAAAPAKAAAPPKAAAGSKMSHSIAFDQYSMIIDGKRTFVWSGEMHPFRLPSPALWRDVLEK